MWRKQEIIEMIEKTEDIRKIRIIYNFVMQLLSS